MPFVSRILGGFLILAAAVGPTAASDGPADAPPFAFLYGGKPSSAFIATWKAEADPKAAAATSSGAGAAVKSVSYKDPATGLRVLLTSTVYRDFPAVEWVVRMRNEGTADTPLIQDLMACDVALSDFGAGPVELYRALGSNADRTDFAPVRDTLNGSAAVKFGPSGGRSSDNTALPFFNIAAEGKGIVAGIGWSGKWRAAVEKTDTRGLRLTAGMDATRFKLHPGEEVRTASIALLFWKSGER